MQGLRLLAVDGLDARIAHYRECDGSRRRSSWRRRSTSRAALPRAALRDQSCRRTVITSCWAGWRPACAESGDAVASGPDGRRRWRELRHEYPDHHTIDDASIERLIAQATPRRGRTTRCAAEVGSCRRSASSPSHSPRVRRASPQPHPKTWGSLFHNSRLAALRSAGRQRGARSSPPFRRSTCTDSKPRCWARSRRKLFSCTTANRFFPPTCARALAAMPAPRVLVTTPAHLQGAGGRRHRTTAAGPRGLGHRAACRSSSRGGSKPGGIRSSWRSTAAPRPA